MQTMYHISLAVNFNQYLPDPNHMLWIIKRHLNVRSWSLQLLLLQYIQSTSMIVCHRLIAYSKLATCLMLSQFTSNRCKWMAKRMVMFPFKSLLSCLLSISRWCVCQWLLRLFVSLLLLHRFTSKCTPVN